MDYTHQAPLSMAFPRPEYWSRLPFFSTQELNLPLCVSCIGGVDSPEPPGKPLVLYLIAFLSFISDLENILEESNNNFKTKNSTHFIAPFYYMNV